MLGLTLEQTRVYQEAEILKAAVPLLLKTGMSVEQIAQELNVNVEAVRLAAKVEVPISQQQRSSKKVEVSSLKVRNCNFESACKSIYPENSFFKWRY